MQEDVREIRKTRLRLDLEYDTQILCSKALQFFASNINVVTSSQER